MKYSNLTKSFVHELIIDNYKYRKFCEDTQSYYLDVENLDEDDRCKLAAYIMSDEDLAREVTGPDNDEYEKNMLSSFIKYLMNIADKDCQSDFIETWKDGAVKYLSRQMQMLLDSTISNIHPKWLEACSYEEEDDDK